MYHYILLTLFCINGRYLLTDINSEKSTRGRLDVPLRVILYFFL